jgi:uncharacterized protein (TIGR02246 family)
MKSIAFFLAAFAFAGMAQTSTVSQQIGAQEELLWTTFAKGDAAALLDLMMPDYLHIGETIEGRDIVRQVLTQCHINYYKLGEKQVRVLNPDSALVVYPIAEDVTCGSKDKPQQMTMSNNATSVWVRNSAGQWKLQAQWRLLRRSNRSHVSKATWAPKQSCQVVEETPGLSPVLRPLSKF